MAPPIRIRFEVPRSEVERAQEAAERAPGALKDFDREHLRGRVRIEVGVPFEPDPVLDFLRGKRGLAAGVPHAVSLDQPVAYVVGQVAAATVIAAFGETAPMIPLTGGVGALGIAREGEDALAFSLPLEHYAGVAVVPLADGARAVAAAAGSLESLLGASVPAVAQGPFGRFLGRERAILDAAAAARRPPEGDPMPVRVLEPGSVEAASRAFESEGAHLVPYWAVTLRPDDGSGAEFTPLRAPRRAGARGALALAIFPGGARPLVASVPSSPEAEATLRARLARPTPFVARLDPARGDRLAIEALGGGLPMAGEGSH